MAARRLGAIDVGSNAIRLRIVETNAGSDVVREVDAARAPVRLGRDVFKDGALSRQTLDDAARALAAFRARMVRAGVTTYRAVATSATREASNGAELVRRVRRAGLDLEVIDGLEEARLVHVGVTRALRLEGTTALADVGGGSTEVSILEGTRRSASASLPLGTVRMLEAWHPDGGPVRRRKLEVLGAVVDRALSPVSPDLARADRVVATGGTVKALAKLCGRDGHAVRVARIHEVLGDLRRMDERERERAFGLRADRADTIIPAAVVVLRVAAAVGADVVEAPGVGLRDGVLAELAVAVATSARRAGERYAVAV